MKVRWLRAGTRSLRFVHAWIAYDNPQAAKDVVKRIRSSVARLEVFPFTGRQGHVQDTMELVVPKLPYVVIYRVREDRVEILRVFHTSRDRSKPLH